MTASAAVARSVNKGKVRAPCQLTQCATVVMSPRGTTQVRSPCQPLHSEMSALRLGAAQCVPAFPGLQCSALVRFARLRPARAQHSAHSCPPRAESPQAEDASVLVIGQRSQGQVHGGLLPEGLGRGRKGAFPPPVPSLRSGRRYVIEEVYLERLRFFSFLVFTFFSSSGAGLMRHLPPACQK